MAALSRAGLLGALLRLCAWMPLPLAHGLGVLLGWLLYAMPTRSRHITQINLALCLPEQDRRSRGRLTRRSLAETGKALTESGAVWLWPGERACALVHDVTGEALVREALSAGRGVILAFPHLGCWELVALYCSSRRPMTTLYRPPRVAALDALLRRGRERMGARLVPTDARGVRALYEALRQGQLIGILPDQEPAPGNGVFAPFFGVPAWTQVLLPRLARRTGAAVVYAYAERLPRGQGFRVHFLPAPSGLSAATPEQGAAVMNQGTETCIRRLPEQYQWSYRRFRTHPTGSPAVY